MSFPGMHGVTAAGGGGDPLDYGDDLIAFWESETNVNDTGGEVDDWTDQGDDALVLSQISGNTGPDLESNTQNGFDGISFEEFVLAEPINKKLRSTDSELDNIFFDAGTKTISFAARWDRTQDQTFGLDSIICSKGYAFGKNEGWVLWIRPTGNIQFRQYMTNGNFWAVEASGFYSVDDLVLGSLTYSGGNTSGSGSFRLWNGSSFVTTGTVTTASGSSTKFNDASDDFIVGNMHDPADTSDNAPFEGPIFGLWITKPSQISLDDQYMQRWVP